MVNIYEIMMHRSLSNITGFPICKLPTLFVLNCILISITNLENT